MTTKGAGSRLGGGVWGLEVPCPLSGGGQGWVLYSEFQWIMGNGHMGTPLPPGENDGQTRLKTLPSRDFLGGK